MEGLNDILKALDSFKMAMDTLYLFGVREVDVKLSTMEANG